MDAAEAKPAGAPPRLRWYQCSLRTLLVLVLLASLGISWPALRMQRAREQKAHVQAIRRIEGCQVAYDGEDVFTFAMNTSNTLPPLPPVSWTESLFGRDFVHRAGTVGVPEDRVDEVLPHLQQLPYLRRVVVLKTDASSDERFNAAAQKIQTAVPGVESVLLQFDLEITDNTETATVE